MFATRRSPTAAVRKAAAVAAACVLTLVLLSGCGAVHTTTDASLRATPAAHGHPARPRRRGGRVVPLMPASAPDVGPVAALGRAMTRALKGMGSHTGALVVNLGDDQELYALRSAGRRPPASLEKLYTTVAALDLLGPGARLRTRIEATGHLGAHGVWDGNLYLVGGGDPTFGDGYWNTVYEDGQGPTAAQLVAQLRRRGIRRVSGRLYADASLFDGSPGGPATHDRPDIPDYGGELSALVYDHGMSARHLGPAEYAAHEVGLTMRLSGIRVSAARQTRTAPARALLLAQVFSPPLRTLVRLMDVPSDDLFADLLAKQLGARLFHAGTLAGGAIEIGQLLAARYGIKPTLFDGSGLDRADRTSPAQLVSLLGEVYGKPVGRELWAALPVLARQGTVQGIGGHTDAAGRCVAKTGTLDNVTNLAGYCRARRGKTLAFALFVDGPPNWLAVTALSKAVAAIAAY